MLPICKVCGRKHCTVIGEGICLDCAEWAFEILYSAKAWLKRVVEG
jgi:hypothetical protein